MMFARKRLQLTAAQWFVRRPKEPVVSAEMSTYRRVSTTSLPLSRFQRSPFQPCNTRCIVQDASLWNNQCTLDNVKYEDIANTTLDLLAEFLESLSDDGLCPDDFDVQLSSGVLTVFVGGDFGTYVINKQSPNRQIWLSSPTSGPKRYDYVDGRWIYSHTGEDLNDLLSDEFSEIFNRDVDFSMLKYRSETDG